MLAVAALAAMLFGRSPSRSREYEAGLGSAVVGGGPGRVPMPGQASGSDHGYLRRLKVVEPPAPGEIRAASARDATVVQAETSEPAAGGGTFAAGSAAGPAFQPNLPSGGSSASASPEPSFQAVAAPPRRQAGVKDSAAPGGSDQAALAASSKQAKGLVAGGRLHLNEIAADHGNPLSPTAVMQAVKTQIAKDDARNAAVRDALADLGPGASLQDQQAAVASALSKSGAPAGEEDVAQAMAQAVQPPRPAPSAAAVQNAIQQVSGNMPSPSELNQLSQDIMQPPPPPNAPPPKGGVDAYVKYKDAFDRVEKDDGLKPSQVVPFPAIESSFGSNTGKFPLRNTLMAIATNLNGSFTAAQQRQASADLTALTKLIANNDLGGRTIDQIYGSNMGAIGITQFLPTSWDAYAVSAKGGPRDPWNFSDAVLSTGNFLKHHGAPQNYNQSILSYNHSTEYQGKILQYGANVDPGIKAVQQQAHAAPAPER